MQAIKIKSKNIYVLIIALVVTSLSILISYLRYLISGTFFIGSETYFHLNNLINPLNFYESIISFFIHLFGESFVVIVLPAILLFFSILLISDLIKYFIDSNSEYFSALFILVLTPAFLSSFLGLTIISVISFLIILTMFLYVKNSYFYLLPILFLFLVDPLIAILLNIFLLIKELLNSNYYGVFTLLFSLTIFSITLLSINRLFFLIKQVLFSFDINLLFSFFGGRFGYSLFIIILGLFGLFRSKRSSFELISMLSILIISVFYVHLRLVGIFVLVIYSAQSFNYLLKRKWEVPFLGQIITLLFICMLLFSTIIFIKGVIYQEPSLSQITSLDYLSKVSLPKDAKILSMPENAEFISYYTNRDVFVSDFDSKKEILFSKELILNRDYSEIKSVFQKEKIALIIVDFDFMNLVNRPDEGLLFVMNNNANFEKIYYGPEYTIYFFKLWNEKN